MKLKPADVAWARQVKERDEWTCQRCLKFFPEDRRQGLHAHHIFGRGRPATKHEVLNGVSLCYGCHMWAHANRREFDVLMEQRLTTPEFLALEARSHGKPELSEQILAEYERVLEAQAEGA